MAAGDFIAFDLDCATENDASAKLEKTLAEFGGYIRKNSDFMANYGDKWRNGERISSGFVESAVNQIVARRWSKNSRCVGRHASQITGQSALAGLAIILEAHRGHRRLLMLIQRHSAPVDRTDRR